MRPYQLLVLLLALSVPLPLHAQRKKAFSWINPLTEAELDASPVLSHHTFDSEIAGEEVGYCVFLPPGYHDPQNRNHRYPVMYMLHGGRPGDESIFARQLPDFLDAINDQNLIPSIVVLNNGGPVSHYNVPGRADSRGKDLFLKELIPLIDANYRTIAHRTGRALRGYSQGGRATARIGFGHPELFSQIAIGSPGAATEKRIQESGGTEIANLVFAPGDDMWTYAETYAKNNKEDYPIDILLHVGDAQDFNYDGTVAYSAFLSKLGLAHDFTVLANQKHGYSAVARMNPAIIAFHQYSFERSLKR